MDLIGAIGFAVGMVNVVIDLGKLIHHNTRSTKSNAKQCALLADLVEQIMTLIENEFKDMHTHLQIQLPSSPLIDVKDGPSIDGQIRNLEHIIRAVDKTFSAQTSTDPATAAFVKKFEDCGIVKILLLFKDVYLQCEAYVTKGSRQKSWDKDKDKRRFDDLWTRLIAQLGLLSIAANSNQTAWMKAQFDDQSSVLASISIAIDDLIKQIDGFEKHLDEVFSRSEHRNLNLTQHLVFVMNPYTVTPSGGGFGIKGFGTFVSATVGGCDDGMVLRRQLHPRQFASFVKECTLMIGIKHDNVLKFFGTYQPPETADKVDMVYVRCRISVTMALDDGTLTTNDKLSIGLGVAKGMRYLHERTPQVIHKALTLTNVLLCEKRPTRGYTETMVKIANFSQAESFGNVTQANVVEKSGLDVAYMAPEFFISGRNRTFKIDVYAFGVFLNMMFGGLPPRHALDFDGDLDSIKYDEGNPDDSNFKFPIVVLDVLDQPKLNHIVRNCLSGNPASRYAFDTIVSKLKEC